MKKAIILARVSTSQQQKQGLSIEEIQLPKLYQYAKENDIEIVKEYVFQETASQKLRKKFDEMIAFVKASPEIKAILGFRVDRLTRNYRDAVEMDLLRIEHDKELHFVDDRLVLTAKSFGRDIDDWDTKVFFAKRHINRCQEDSFNTIQSKLRNGEIFNKAPYGYENYKDENNRSGVRIRPFESNIVKQVFDWYSSGAYSYTQIQGMLKDLHNVNIHRSKVEKIIRNSFYVGYQSYNGELHPHKYEAIITKEIWGLAEGIRSGRGIGKKKGKLSSRHGLYRGLIYCKVCGCSMTAEPHKKKQKNGNIHEYTYYHCTNSKQKHGKIWIEEKQLTKQFAGVFKLMTVPAEELEHITKLLRESHDGKINFNRDVFNEYNTQIQKLEKRIEVCYEDRLDGRITQEEYDNYRKRYRKEQQDYKDKLERLESADEEYYLTASYLLELASRSYDLFIGSEPDEKREIIQLVFQNLLFDNGNLEYIMYKPFDSIFKSASSLRWGG